ncbi:survival motor neuron (SMN) interacting protein 1 (SIP1) domain-containing protein [Hirsutella rhossiliensis]|uniref:Survival motor neuron (SMN) interacting protein 1 (SIP1) domain-containing protein n=1 Tax=Hirsutella rhossiliensis TaxID=111463 RepID=A0A9P8MWU9_9HYPO|nr:survival motor neuron (SMN) interacting protein 1 (SIP1) domain-containing protein [Hirsutella rhossiliensis]KAH0961859.1 survival motor neuron (SMN) interacting protein 1 (SIP1) domain-containing protein [Hirsutella rhossiliensis]
MSASAAKRDYDDVDEGEVSADEPIPKRAKRLTGAQPRHHHQHSAIDPTWGQKYVFSNKDDATSIPYGEESDFEDDAEAMAYLRSVRQEAHGISHLLVAPTRQIGPQLPPELQEPPHDDDGEAKPELDGHRNVHAAALGDAKAYYEDGAYIARDPEAQDGNRHGEADNDQDSRERELHEAFFASTLDRYRCLRRLLHSKPPPGAAKRLSIAQSTYAASLGPNSTTAKKWSTILRTADPHPLQLALMSKDSVLRILRVLLGGKFLCRGYTLSERTSQWLWGLLARLPDPWELNHAELALVRDLGRRAVLLGRSLTEMAALKAELDDGMMGVPEGVDASSDDDEPTNTDIKMEGPSSHCSEVHENPPQEMGDIRQDSHKDDDADVEEGEEGEIDEHEAADGSESVEMDLSSDSGEGGEVVSGGHGAATDDTPTLEAAKAALLGRLADDAPGQADKEDNLETAKLRLRINMRATLNMILTVAGDFYGQRDLLEFREPFVGL